MSTQPEKPTPFDTPRCSTSSIAADQSQRDLLAAQIAIDRNMAERRTMLSKVRQRIVDLAHQQILAIIQAGYRFCYGLTAKLLLQTRKVDFV